MQQILRALERGRNMLRNPRTALVMLARSYAGI